MKVIKNTPFFVRKRQTYLFLHIPKTGGTAYIDTFLKGYDGGGHLHLKQIQEKYPTLYEDSFKYTIYRDDYSRFVSFYNWIKGGSGPDTHLYIYLQKSTTKHIEAFRILKNLNAFTTGQMCQIHTHPNKYFYQGESLRAFGYDDFQKSVDEFHAKMGFPQKQIPIIRKSKVNIEILPTEEKEMRDYFDYQEGLTKTRL